MYVQDRTGQDRLTDWVRCDVEDGGTMPTRCDAGERFQMERDCGMGTKYGVQGTGIELNLYLFMYLSWGEGYIPKNVWRLREAKAVECGGQ